jgi:hypothetical protein
MAILIVYYTRDMEGILKAFQISKNIKNKIIKE